ncbi:hypothetical protein JZL88_25780, partial [Escherichia coli]|nr:hypothetical protein [Escherichia coli]
MPGTGKMKHVSLTLQVENDLKHQLSMGTLNPTELLINKNLVEELGMRIPRADLTQDRVRMGDS